MITRHAHDPERRAEAYVSGDLRPRERRRFEEHLVDCEECWREVRLGREGRRLAEAARELAPPGLRDDVRGAILLEPIDQPRRVSVAARVAVAGLAVTAALVAAVALSSGPAEPTPIVAAASAFRNGLAPSGPASRPAPDFGSEGYALSQSGRFDLGGLQVDSFSYRGTAGDNVLLLMSDSPFPTASDATLRAGPYHGWVASLDHLTLVCGDRPMSYLLVGSDAGALLRLEGALS